MTNGDQPAFPVVIQMEGFFVQKDCGLTKREWFAGQALAGWLAGPRKSTSDSPELSPGYVADACAVYADALIAALEKEGK